MDKKKKFSFIRFWPGLYFPHTGLRQRPWDRWSCLRFFARTASLLSSPSRTPSFLVFLVPAPPFLPRRAPWWSPCTPRHRALHLVLPFILRLSLAPLCPPHASAPPVSSRAHIGCTSYSVSRLQVSRISSLLFLFTINTNCPFRITFWVTDTAALPSFLLNYSPPSGYAIPT